MSCHDSLIIKNFTVFRDARFTFHPKLNVIIGGNGSGKSHLLKLLYGSQKAGFECQYGMPDFVTVLTGLFGPLSHVVSKPGQGDISIIGSWDESRWVFKTNGRLPATASPVPFPSMTLPVIIPAEDMLAHTKHFGAPASPSLVDFDGSYRDVVSYCLAPEQKDNDAQKVLLRRIAALMHAEIINEDDRFFFITQTGKIPAYLASAGLRKLGTLYMLIRNGFLMPGSTLFWDEPEANISPTMLDPLVSLIIGLSNSGVQTFVTTHSYELLKQFGERTGRDDVRFFSLELAGYRVIVHTTDIYDTILLTQYF